MKTLSLLVFLPPLLFLAGTSIGAEPVLDQGVYIYSGANPLEVDRHSTPEVVDWNNDGRKDLVIGQFTDGNIWVFLNKGTDLNPVFDGGDKIFSEGIPITTTYG